MSTQTARWKLTKADYIDQADVGVIDNNFDILDQMQSTLCTRLSRPAAPIPGQVIYESDTGYERVWNGVSLAWEATNVIRTTSVAARPVGALIGDRLVETDTGFVRMWNGTRWRALGGGYAAYGEIVVDITPVAAAYVDVNALLIAQTIVGDGVTPYNFRMEIPNSFATGGAPTEIDQLYVSLMQSIDGAAYADIYSGIIVSNHTASGQFSQGLSKTRRVTPAAGHTYAYKLQAKAIQGTSTWTIRGTAVQPIILAISEG